MKIKEITDGKAGKVFIHLEEGPSFPLGRNEMKKLALKEGMELREEQLSWILDELVFTRGRNFLIHLLVSRDYTVKEIEKKYKKAGYPDIVIEKVICYALERHYLDDERYAEDFVRVHRESKSIRQIMYKLKEKGIPESVLRQIEAEDEEETLYPQVQRYWNKKQGTAYEKKAKTYQYFVRKGYSSSLVRSLIGRVEDEER